MKVNKPEAEKTVADQEFEALAAKLEQDNINAALETLKRHHPACWNRSRARRTY